MKVIYRGRPFQRNNLPPKSDSDVIELLSNNWDDFGYKTSFPVVCRLKGEIVELELVRLLIDNVYNSSRRLDQLLEGGWNGEFPIPGVNYISTPSDITFYEQIEGLLGTDAAIAVAQLLHDASYLVRVSDDEAARALVETEGFKKSLQRERGSVKAYLDAWRIFERQAIAVLDLGFKFEDVFGDISTLELKYQSESRLPHDINVLIGPNGSGKSRVLHQMVRDWISPGRTKVRGFVEKPNLSQIVVVSYSPFERFPVDLLRRKLQDTHAYRYFGFRGRSVVSDDKKLGSIKLSHQFPKRNAAQALVDCLTDDKRFHSIRDWAQKVKTVESVLATAIEFDYAAVEVASDGKVEKYYDDTTFIEPLGLDVTDSEKRRYIPISSDRIQELNSDQITENLRSESGVIFFRDGRAIELSSGQRLFAYIVINILGAIRRNSLILVDEPELFLHPTLEIQFVNMLKTILKRFNSKALLATHSVVTVREVPADCVHVFEQTEEGLVLKHPPFQTFGGDFQRISSYVFGDKAVSKPFEAWIRAQLNEFDTADDFIEAMQNELNEELIVQIKAMERGQW
ncbi:ABC-type Mn2+/Zn2+ transport system ATPase subunit [Phyllobacterium trifolii]|uniref:ABC-type Mn2+/Zn2+ transport system ATPase subunit n=1 Tax=Phyllobacterium trifolii TaxID=300193 RepID=A0A839U815_9HYPH|nr:ATP-binding protein [Phyllobacterium trifolii]MBB3146908.1 ABC-type Mn2+/Zn2+ transport system ATPase subunit [Phyllobacterium trifolii]